jgi:hypothetical protein
MFSIDADNSITALTAADAPAPGSLTFSSAAGLAALKVDLVEAYSQLAGVTPVKKFTDRKTGAKRIWAAIQTLAEGLPADNVTAATSASSRPKAASSKAARGKSAQATGKAREGTRKTTVSKAAIAREGSKKQATLAMLERKHGATFSVDRNAR